MNMASDRQAARARSEAFFCTSNLRFPLLRPAHPKMPRRSLGGYPRIWFLTDELLEESRLHCRRLVLI
jgi:hypothetical protein